MAAGNPVRSVAADRSANQVATPRRNPHTQARITTRDDRAAIQTPFDMSPRSYRLVPPPWPRHEVQRANTALDPARAHPIAMEELCDPGYPFLGKPVASAPRA